MKIRAMPKKFTGYVMSGYQASNSFANSVISQTQWMYLLKERLMHEEGNLDILTDLQNAHNFTDGIPKKSLFVKLNPNLSQEDRDFISNGIRSFFPDD